jgi:A/G-specific adenine glycosylase
MTTLDQEMNKSPSLGTPDNEYRTEFDELSLEELGPRVRVDYAPEGEYGRQWLRGLLRDLADDGLVEVEERPDGVVAALHQ